MKKYAALLLACLLATQASANEGMWLYNQLPKLELSDSALENLRLASVRIGGGSGAFVSSGGLMITNQHLVANCAKDGFYAPTQAEETPCPGLDAAVLLSIEDVTAEVKAAAKGGLAQRDAAMARLEKECGDCTVVKLFSGGRYDLYRYKKYSDLRLVFAPEQQLAFFGRERDSITYLRYGLDIAFLRAYENGKPAATPHYLKWSAEGVKDGDLVFASGNPGVTTRSTTAAQLTFYRDTALPLAVARLGKQPMPTALAETYKSAAGKLIGLRDDRLVLRKTLFDQKIRHAVERDPKLGTEAGKVWDEVAAAYKSWRPFEKAYQILEGAPAPGSVLFRNARQPGTGGPVNEPMEIVILTRYLEELKALGEKEAPIKAILAGRTPQVAAEAMVKSGEVARLAQALEGPASKLRKKREDLIGSLEVSAAEKIAGYRLLLFGAADYPDGTGSPRVEFGVVKGYTDRAGIAAPWAATFGGLYYRRNNEGPYQVPQRWLDTRASLSMVTPLDFVSTCDIGGGDYGSPTINRAGELVGVIFDGNLESLPGTYLYNEEHARAVHVASQGIAEALEKVYKAAALLHELGVASARGASSL